jgi:hypothetical protein
MRVKRGTLPSTHEGRRLYVLLNTELTNEPERPHNRTDDRTSELIATLREQLQAERQAHSEARRLLAAALERIPPQLEAPSEAREPDVSPGPTDELGEAREELGAEQARREMAESTLHEGMAEERRRREEAERERDYLRRELFGLREPRESPESAEEQQARGEPHSDPGGAQETSESLGGRGSGTARGSWWRRMFGS